jgi:hypothetical protein
MVVGSRAVVEGAEFAAETITSVASNWEPEPLIERAAPDFLESTPPEKLRQAISFFGGRLGPLKSSGATENGQWRVAMRLTGLEIYTSHYMDCEFEHGPGRVTIQLVKRGGKWEVLGFRVNADQLIQDPS